LDLKGTNVLLTGASSGVGRALAKRLADRGARLAIAARREDLLEGLADEVEGAGAPRPAVLPTDLSRPGEAAKLAGRAVGELGDVDVLVNNAGSSVQGLVWAVADADAAREVFEVNVWSPLALVAAVVPRMRARGSGSVVNVTSLAYVSPFPRLGHYCASKGALAVATEALRLELRGSGVGITEIALGPVDTASSYENRLLPGVDRWLDRTKPGSADAAAKRIVTAIERGRARVVHPRRLGIAHALPGLGRRFSARLSDRVEEDDPTVRRGGSQGDEAIRAAREEWRPRARGAAGGNRAGVS
jgi:short-subunit dehydrogenase